MSAWLLARFRPDRWCFFFNMNVPLQHPDQFRAAAGLAQALMDRDGCMSVIDRGGVGTAALLDQTERELSSRGVRCVRAYGTPLGGLALRGLIAQIVGQPDPGALTDNDLKAGFLTLTKPGEGYGLVALLVADAHNLLPSAIRYIQLACRSSPTRLRVLLAGQAGLVATLASEEFAQLHRVTQVLETPKPAGATLPGRVPPLPNPSMPAARRGGAWPLARLGMGALIVPIVGGIWWRHLPASPVPAINAGVLAQDVPPVQPVAAEPAAAVAEAAKETAPSEPDPALEANPPAEDAAVAAEPDAATPDVTGLNAAPAALASDAPPSSEAPGDLAALNTEPPATAAPERAEAPTAAAKAAAIAAPEAATPAPDAVPPPPPPQPHGTLTVTAALTEASQAAQRTRAAAQKVQAPAPPARTAEDRPNLNDQRRCRDIVLRAQLGKDPSDADTQFLRSGCHSS